MLQLNLLPPEEKLRLAYATRARALVALGGGLIGVLMVFSLLLLPSLFALTFQKAEVLRALWIESQAQDRSGLAARASAVEEINRLAERVMQSVGVERPLADILMDSLGRVPSSVRLERVRYRAGESEVLLEGFSPTRSALLDFRRALESSPHVSSVNLPVSNLIRERDITFSLMVKLR